MTRSLTKTDRVQIVAAVRKASHAASPRLDDEQLRQAVTLALSLHEAAFRVGYPPQTFSFSGVAVEAVRSAARTSA